MKAKSITVILMMFIVSITAIANERQRTCQVALERTDISAKEVDVTN
ncbi:MAG: hypothetical protein V3S15_04435 [Woeseiaceae bacterium]